MAFGKIVVEDESGERQVYDLDKLTTSVGRQAGNDIVLNTTAVSRYHAQFAAAEGVVYLVDLGGVNGTFVNDERIPPESRIELKEGDVVTLGDVRLTYYPREVRSDISLTPQVSLVQEEGVPFRLYVEDPAQTVSPGARLRLAVIIENLTGEEQLYSVAVGGMDRKWATANRQQVRLDAYEQTEVTIAVRPPRASNTRSGIYPLTVTVAIKDDPTRALDAVREIDVVGYSGFGMVMQRGGRPDTYHIAVQNQGNIPLGIKLGGYNRDKLLRYKFEPSEVTMEPGETKQIVLTLFEQNGAGETPIPFAVVARSLDASGYQAPLYAVYNPGEAITKSGTWWAGLFGLPLLALGGVILFIILLGILFLPRLLRGPDDVADVGDSTVGDVTDVTEPAAAAGPATPTQIPTQAPSQEPSPTIEPTLEPTETSTEEPVDDGVNFPPEVAVNRIAFEQGEPPGAVTVRFGEFYALDFVIAPNLLAGAANWRINADGQPLFQPLPLGSEATTSASPEHYVMPVWEIMRHLQSWPSVGQVFDFVLWVTPSEGGDAIEQQVRRLQFFSEACRIEDETVSVYAWPDVGTEIGPFDFSTREIVVIGKYTDSAEAIWLRIASYDPGSTVPLAIQSQRWVRIDSPALVTCSGVSIDLNNYTVVPDDLVGPEAD